MTAMHIRVDSWSDEPAWPVTKASLASLSMVRDGEAAAVAMASTLSDLVFRCYRSRILHNVEVDVVQG